MNTRVYDTYSFARIIAVAFDLDRRQQESKPGRPAHRDIISVSQHQEPKGPNLMNRCCVFIFKKENSAKCPSVQLLLM